MNKSIRHGAVFSLLLTFILLINVTIIQGFREQEYAMSGLNARSLYAAQQIPRGTISTDGVILAESSPAGDETFQRGYPNSPVVYGPIVGYLSDQYGAGGLEYGFNGVLSGTDDSVSAGRTLAILATEPEGANIELTLDNELQHVAFDQFSSHGYVGSAVALRPSTGEILAMVSTPSFDPNPIVNSATADTAWQELTNDPANPMLNKATQDVLPPGSIFKIITTAAGLRNGYSPDSTLTGASAITLANTTTQLTNYGGQTCNGQESVTLLTAFQYSCNTAFVQMATELGADPLRQAADAFGVGQSYDLGLPMAAGGLGDVPDLASAGQTAIGQLDVTMSSLQAAIMAATVANDGVRMEPYLVDRITKKDLSVLSTTKPKELAEAVTPEEAATIEQLMFASERSTAGYDGNGFASKTGTAEHGDGLPPHVWYVAYDPSKDVAVGVVVKNGGGYGSSATGGQVAAPIGRAMLYAAPAGGA
ncbi:penicillin-binding transpeptidase domain-containing protein [Corynebacterium uterequi]|uniref:Cell division protein FtsI/penicillin-binding protein 2 n=1 Tax=Corynebacterium uterequi TaxID=1072256 RepID=A0A0G3H9M4_9CORY|nr:penicillin-binding transpeptidase domain-containing protein [Corynebacterium uterequi]AKK10071.1 cell division protein FtsI/penicillin-binding protein 2 [Corynebacterium uterequi]